MPKFSMIFDTSSNGVVSFTAEDKDEAIRMYEGLLNGDIHVEDLDNVEESTEDSSYTFYELKTAQGELIAE